MMAVIIECPCCKKRMFVGDEKTVRIERGIFGEYERNGDYIKVSIDICVDCYLTDPDLCAFFNRIGHRIR